jgi:hypothetical protein
MPYKTVLVTRGSIQTFPCRILIDPGAEINYISTTYTKKHKISTKRTDYSAEWVQGSTERLHETSNFVKLSMGSNYTEELPFSVMPLHKYDVIIGKQWLSHYNPQISMRSNQMSFSFIGKPVTINADISKESHFISKKELKRGLKKGVPTFAVYIRDINEHPKPGNSAHPKESVQDLLEEFKDVFPEDLPDGLPPERSHDFKIILQPLASPQKRPLYKLSQVETEELQKQLAELLGKGFIKPSSSPWGSPILFVNKKDGGTRMCVDYRALNQLTVKNCYPLPRLDDIFDKLRHAQFFSKIDLRSGYHQIRLDPDSVPLTAFRTKYGLYEFLVLPFGLTNAPAIFMSLMNDVFRDCLDKFVMVYLDDILIYSSTYEEHIDHLRHALVLLRKNSLFAKLSKCEFAKSSVSYLGHIISDEGFSMEEDKIASIQHWPTPSCKRDVQSFLGLVNFYRRFIRNCSRISRPLTKITGNIPFTWTSVEQEAFDALRIAVTSAPVLRAFDPDLPTFVTTDASGYAIGAVLEQKTSDSCRPVAYFSRTMSPAEQNYHPQEQELLAIIESLRHWRAYLHGRPFIVNTDHESLKYLQTQDHLSSRQVRWMESLIEFDFQIKYIKGKTNVVADALSRQIKTSQKPEQQNKELLESLVKKTTFINAISQIHLGTGDFETLSSEYSTDPEFKELLNTTHSILPYIIHNGLIYRENRLCIPCGATRQKLLHDCHDIPSAGHLGIKKTISRITQNYYWRNLRKTVRDYIMTCDICQRTKSSTQKPIGLLHPLPIPEERWECVSMDFITPLPATSRGNTGILVVVDRFSKMMHAVPTPSHCTAITTANLYHDFIYRYHGLPKTIVSDRDPIFMSNFWRNLFAMVKVRLTPSSSYHPQTDGQTEIVNKKIEEMLRCFVDENQSNWDQLLVEIEVAYNSAPHSATLCSPFYLNYGLHPRTIPIDAVLSVNPAANDFIGRIHATIKAAHRSLQHTQDSMIKFANRSRREHLFSVNDLVLLSTANLSLDTYSGARKLMPKYCGPFKIVKIINDVTMKLDLPPLMLQRGIHNVFHVSNLRPYHPDQNVDRAQITPPPIQLQDGTTEYEVEKIVRHRIRNHQTEYLVQWTGYPSHENTWQTSDDLSNAPDALADYHARVEDASASREE